MTESRPARTAIKGFRWREPSGRTHAVNLDDVLTGKKLRWTCCGMFDLLVDEGWQSNDTPTCAACRIWADMASKLDAIDP